jgi:hypothetical protein
MPAKSRKPAAGKPLLSPFAALAGSPNPRGELYHLCTDVAPPLGGWFSLADVLGRALRSVCAFYYLVLTHPISFFAFSCRYNRLWYGGALGVAATCLLFPVWPLAVFCVRVGLKLKNLCCKQASFDDGNVFFVAPDNPAASMLWDFFKEFSVYVSLFIMCGDDDTAVAHSWYDEITQKDFWRRHLTTAGARVPQTRGRWEGAAPCNWAGDANQGTDDMMIGDVVIKLPDSYLGIGDSFLEVGKDGFDGTRGAIERVLKENYNNGKGGVLVLDWVRPGTGHEVHSLDILTAARADGTGVELVSCLYWGKCADGKSTHSSKAGYVCDVDGEKIMAPAAWYSAYFEKEMGGETVASNVDHGVGFPLPGLRAVCERAVKSHESVLKEQPWLQMCGWDAIYAKQGPVFFEGNFAAHRIPRRVFLTWTNTFHFLSTRKTW